MTYVRTKLKREISISHIITIHYFEYMKNFVFLGETHNFWEFLYVDKGQVLVQADNRHYELKTGDIIFHKPNEFHAIESIGSNAPNLVVISFCTSSAAMKQFHQQCFTVSLEERMLIAQVIDEAKQAFATPLHIPAVEQVEISDHSPFGSQQLIILNLEMLFILLKRNHLDKRTGDVEKLSLATRTSLTSKTERMNQILQYMEIHICKPLTIQDICNASSLSRSALQDLFYKEKGCGAISYFNRLKIEHAKNIIRDGSMNITEIAHYFSYSSLQYFSKQFKKATGMSPITYASSVKGISHLS